MSGLGWDAMFDGSDPSMIPVAPIDVLQVMEDAARRIYVSAETQDDNDASEALLQAHAAVAELIEAASPVCMALHASRMIMADKECREYAGEICDRLKVALARVGGAA